MGGWGHVRALQPSLPSRILPICTTFLGGKAHARHVPGQSDPVSHGSAENTKDLSESLLLAGSSLSQNLSEEPLYWICGLKHSGPVKPRIFLLPPLPHRYISNYK